MQTCNGLSRAACRSFWIYLNIDIDSLPCVAGRPRADYTTWTTEELRLRVVKAWSIHKAWRTSGAVPKRVHTCALRLETWRITVVPWTQIVVALGDTFVLLQDWSSGASSLLPLELSDMPLFDIRLFWCHAIDAHIIVLHLG
jgi:hypothetical protein